MANRIVHNGLVLHIHYHFKVSGVDYTLRVVYDGDLYIAEGRYAPEEIGCPFYDVREGHPALDRSLNNAIVDWATNKYAGLRLGTYLRKLGYS